MILIISWAHSRRKQPHWPYPQIISEMNQDGKTSHTVLKAGNLFFELNHSPWPCWSGECNGDNWILVLGFLLMLGYFRIDFECIFFCWCWLVFLEVVDCFGCSLDVEVFQCVFVGFWVNFLMFLPVDVWNRMFLKENYHCFLVKTDGNLPSRKFLRLAAHLGLHTPHGATMMVGEQELNWKEGQAIVFDVPLMNKRCWRGSFLCKRTKFKVSDVKVKDYFFLQ